MFRKKQEITVDTRAVLLETAARLFAEQGFEAVSTRQIAKEAHVNMAMIAYYFGSKDGLFQAIIEERMPKLRLKLMSFKELSISPWDKIQLSIDAYVDQIFTNSHFNKLIYRELSLNNNRSIFKEKMLSSMEANFTLIRDFIEEGQRLGDFRTEIDVEMTILTLISTMTKVVNAPSVVAHFLLNQPDITDPEVWLSDRTKQHLKTLLGHQLKKN